MLKDYLEWDIYNWRKALEFWKKHLNTIDTSNKRALELGSRRGGLSLFLAKEYSIKTICSDIFNPKSIAYSKHVKHNVETYIEYEKQNILNLDYKENTFDIIVFKSVIGGLSTKKRKRKAFKEIHRVLKPGGILLFAENAKSTRFHSLLRKKFNRWSRSHWRYPNQFELENYLVHFKSFELRSCGLLALFVRNNFLKKIISSVDTVFEKFIPRSWCYILYGVAYK